LITDHHLPSSFKCCSTGCHCLPAMSGLLRPQWYSVNVAALGSVLWSRGSQRRHLARLASPVSSANGSRVWVET
jgi:hypothetical protein